MAKKLMLAFGVLGLLGLFIPQGGFSWFSVLKMISGTQLIIVLAAFALPTIGGILAVTKPPMQKWQAGLGIAGFGLAAWKFEIWRIFKDFGGLFKHIPTLLIVIAIVGGLIASIMAVVKGEESA